MRGSPAHRRWPDYTYAGMYLALVAIVTYLNVAVSCLGDPKFDRGCGQWGVYYVICLIFAAPAAVVIFGLGRWRIVPVRHRFTIWAAGLGTMALWLFFDVRVDAPAFLLGPAAEVVIPIGIAWVVRLVLVQRGRHHTR